MRPGHLATLAGSDAERRAALDLRDRLTASGRAVDVEPFRFHRRWALAQAIAAALAVAGSVLSVTRPAAGAALVAFATLSAIVEASGVAELLARATGTRASQNVSSPPPDGQAGPKHGLLIVAASYDTPRRSAFGRIAERVGDPWLLVGAAAIAVLLCCVVRLLGLEGNVLTAIQLVPTLLLLTAAVLLVDVEQSPVGDGIAQAAGAETAIALTQRLSTELERLDVWLVLAGAGDALGAGMRAWRRRHRRELSARPAVTIEVGTPDPDELERVVELYAELARGFDAELRRA